MGDAPIEWLDPDAGPPIADVGDVARRRSLLRRAWLPVGVLASIAAVFGLTVLSTSPPNPAGRLPFDPSNPAGARIALPHGWKLLQPAAFAPAGVVYGTDVWCIAPIGISDADVWQNCPIGLTAVARDRLGSLVPDIAGGFLGNPPQPCGGADERASHSVAAIVNFGGRAALFRRWTFTCGADAQMQVWAQYVVPAQPAFVLYSRRADGIRSACAHAARAH